MSSWPSSCARGASLVMFVGHSHRAMWASCARSSPAEGSWAVFRGATSRPSTPSVARRAIIAWRCSRSRQ
eukprot:14212050-Alexandrium_andersonii.AAC.1